MPTVFLIYKSENVKVFHIFLCKARDSRTKTLCSRPDKTAHRTKPHLVHHSNDTTKCVSGASIWDETAKKAPK